MSRFNNNGKAAWGAHRPDTLPNGSSRRPVVGFRNNRRDGGGFNRQPLDDGELEIRQFDDHPPDDQVGPKLDRLLERFDKLDVWRDETVRRFENLDPTLSRETEPPWGFDDGDDWEYGDYRRRRSADKGVRARTQNLGFRDRLPEERGRRDARGRNTSCWDPTGNRHRQQFGGQEQAFDRPISCWDPPQRYQSHASGYEKQQRVKMDPPRFDGSDATNWVSQVQYYFDHLLMPDAQRIHYAVMLFDQPAAEWVFNYCANNDFVTWQDFLEDVHHRFDRQSFKNYYGLIAKLTQTGTVLEYHETFEKYLNRVNGIPESELFTLFIAGLKPDMQERLQRHRPSSLAAAMALVVELADTQADRAIQHQPPANQRRQWQSRDSRGHSGFSPTQQSSQQSATAGQNLGTSGKHSDNPRPPLVRVSQAEKAERARKGLCYFCPEIWVIGHVCKQRLLCYADEDDELAELEEINAELEEKVAADVSHFHAMKGATLDVPNDEAMEEIVKTDNIPLHGLVGTYDEKIDDLSVPTHKELKMKEDIATVLEKENKAEVLRYQDVMDGRLSSRMDQECSQFDIAEKLLQQQLQQQHLQQHGVVPSLNTNMSDAMLEGAPSTKLMHHKQLGNQMGQDREHLLALQRQQQLQQQEQFHQQQMLLKEQQQSQARQALLEQLLQSQMRESGRGQSRAALEQALLKQQILNDRQQRSQFPSRQSQFPLEPKEKGFSVLTEKPSKRECMENQSRVDDIKAGFDMKKQDSQEEMEEKRSVFEDKLKLIAEELGKVGDAHSSSQALACVYVDLNVSNVTSMNPRLPSLDADARLIPPRSDTPCLSFHRCVTELFILALNCHDNNVVGVFPISYIQHGFLLLILGGNDEGRRTTIRWAFDPGGDTSPKLLRSTLRCSVVSTLRTR